MIHICIDTFFQFIVTFLISAFEIFFSVFHQHIIQRNMFSTIIDIVRTIIGNKDFIQCSEITT